MIDDEPALERSDPPSGHQSVEDDLVIVITNPPDIPVHNPVNGGQIFYESSKKAQISVKECSSRSTNESAGKSGQIKRERQTDLDNFATKSSNDVSKSNVPTVIAADTDMSWSTPA